MNIVDEKVEHISFGKGVITEMKNNTIWVKFQDELIKGFVYPDAFDRFLKATSKKLEKSALEDLRVKKEQIETARIEKEKIEAEIRRERAELLLTKKKVVSKVTKKKTTTKAKPKAEDEEVTE